MGCSDETQGNKYGDIDGDCIVEDSTDNLLNKVDGLWRKRGGVIKIIRVLDFGGIGGMRPGVGGILLMFGVGILEIFLFFVTVAWHRDVNNPVGVFPCEGEATEKRSRPVNEDDV